jgi:hypothetical protein
LFFLKSVFSCADYLFGYPLATYLDYFAEAEFAGYSCSGITTVDAGGQGFFSPRHMGGGLVYELIVTRLCQVSSLSLAGCLMLGRGRKLPYLALYQLDVLLLRL